MLDFADIVAINKSDKRGALDALRDVKKQYQRNHTLFDIPVEQMPVFSTTASQCNDTGMNRLYASLMLSLKEKTESDWLSSFQPTQGVGGNITIIPPSRTRMG